MQAKRRIGRVLGGLALTTLLTVSSAAWAREDPACKGKDQAVCDMLANILAAREKLCSSMLSVEAIESQSGGDSYRITCNPRSASFERVTYSLDFGPENKSFEVR